MNVEDADVLGLLSRSRCSLCLSVSLIGSSCVLGVEANERLKTGHVHSRTLISTDVNPRRVSAQLQRCLLLATFNGPTNSHSKGCVTPLTSSSVNCVGAFHLVAIFHNISTITRRLWIFFLRVGSANAKLCNNNLKL